MLALGIGILLFTFSQALALATNPGPFLRDQIGNQTSQAAAPTASFDWTSNGFTVTFSDTSQQGDASITSWDWDFGDGQRSNVRNPTHSYGGNNSYQVSLIVRDDNGKQSTAMGQVDVIYGQTRSGRGLTNPFGGDSLNIDLSFGDILLPVAIALLTIGLFFGMALVGGMITKAGWNLVKPKPETIRVRLKPSHLTQAFQEDASAMAAASQAPVAPAQPPIPPPPPS